MLAHAGGVPESVATGLLGLGLVTGWIGASRLRGRGFGSLPRWGGWALLGLAPVAVVASIAVPSLLWPPPAAIRPRSTATLSFVEPTPNQEITGSMLNVRLRLDGGRIVQSSSTTLTPDTGHIHLFVDGVIVSMTYGKEQRVPLGGLEPGPHVLQAEFVAADHGPFEPRVTATEQFVTEGP
ncbi:MAG TPA: hypothetical protein VFM40_08125 [Actinomycetota bacterium]|nr:hypothetical protein [Actinomycetota bacterium]